MPITSTAVMPAAIAAITLAAAWGIGQTASKSLRTEIEIDAPASAVWAELADFASYPAWNPFVRQISGTLAKGNRLAVTIQPEGRKPMRFAPEVLAATKNRELRWIGRLGFKGVFDGEHFFVLEPTAQGGTLLRHGENFTGMLAHVLLAFIGEDTEKGFRSMNEALKARVEARI